MNEHFILRMTVNPRLLRLRHQRGTFLRLQDASCAFLCSVNVPLCLQNALNVNARSQLGNLRTVGQRSRDCVLSATAVARTNYCTWMPEGHPGGGHRREKLPTGNSSNIWPPQFRPPPSPLYLPPLPRGASAGPTLLPNIRGAVVQSPDGSRR